jgi:hypothetical protein
MSEFAYYGLQPLRHVLGHTIEQKCRRAQSLRATPARA